jgi:hypothetical protein
MNRQRKSWKEAEELLIWLVREARVEEGLKGRKP